MTSRRTPALFLRPDEVMPATEVLAEAFLDDPVMAYVFRGSDDLARALRGFFRIAVSSSLRRGHAYRSPDWEAVALWSPPGAPVMFDAQDTESLGAHIVGEIGIERAQTDDGFRHLMAEHHYSGEHFYLPFLGVRTRGRGHGAALMTPMLQQCDRNRLPAYLESSNPRNIPFYERLGFEVTAQFGPDGAPTVTAMLRPNRPADAESEQNRPTERTARPTEQTEGTR